MPALEMGRPIQRVGATEAKAARGSRAPRVHAAEAGGMKYRTIVIDPPWDYSDTTFRSGAGHGEKYANRPLPYDVMSYADLEALPVGDIADDDAVLFLWTTSRYMPDAFPLVKAWGFSYVQMLVWVKPGPMPLAMPFAPPATEFLLGCKRGRPPRRGMFPSSALVIPQGLHSVKPEAFL